VFPSLRFRPWRKGRPDTCPTQAPLNAIRAFVLRFPPRFPPMANRFTKRILDHMADSRHRPQQIRELASALSVDAEDYQEFAREVSAMIEEGQVVRGSAQTIALPPIGREMVG